MTAAFVQTLEDIACLCLQVEKDLKKGPEQHTHYTPRYRYRSVTGSM